MSVLGFDAMKRIAVAAALVLTFIGGVTIASQRSAASMSSAADKWLKSLSPE